MYPDRNTVLIGKSAEGKITPAAVQKRVETLVTVQRKTPSEALALLVGNNYTRSQYERMAQSIPGVYPCYSIVQLEKTACYAPLAAISISETHAAVDLQELLNITVLRLANFLGTSLRTLSPEARSNAKLISKWGMDGFSQDEFKQGFESPGASDSHVFQSNLVPLLLVTHDGVQEVILWRNSYIYMSTNIFVDPFGFDSLKRQTKLHSKSRITSHSESKHCKKARCLSTMD